LTISRVKSRILGVRKPSKHISGSVKVYSRAQSEPEEPQALQREATTKSQRNIQENTIIWGADDALPLKIAQTLQDSPAASACISTKAKYIKGAGFSDKDLMKVVVNKKGLTLWQLHCMISEAMAWIESFSINFKFSATGKITMAYNLAVENARFVKPDNDEDTEITRLKYNPYFGTAEFNKKYTKEYALFDIEEVGKQIKTEGTKFKGQVYYYGVTKPLYRFYARPDYWSARYWMEVDGSIQQFHKDNLDNGFFQSVLINMIGDPSIKSKNPEYMRREVASDGTVTYHPDRTIGQEFDDMMSKAFSGKKKAGTAMVLWALNSDSVAKVAPFDSSVNSDLFETLQNLTTKNITIATKTPGILANISEGVSLGSGGSEIQKAVELMQANTSNERSVLEQFYNEIFFPNCEIKGITKSSKVEIVNYNPITVPVEIDDKFWNVLNDKEKRDFVRKNFASIELEEEAPQTDSEGNPLPQDQIQVNDNMTNLTGSQQLQLIRIIRQFGQGKINEATATIQLKGFAFSDDEIRKILGLDEAPDQQQPLTVAK
jgi:hypothetical protein